MHEQYSLELVNSHPIATINGNKYLIDTGSPSSFVRDGIVTLGACEFKVGESLVTLDAETLSKSVKSPVEGLLGTDILNAFYMVFDLSEGSMLVSDEELSFAGSVLKIRLFMGIPIISVNVCEQMIDCFFDTGAPVSYCQLEAVAKHESIGVYEDFYPMFGTFQTELYQVEFSIGNEAFALKTGKLPELLAMALMLGSADGIVGNELLLNRKVGYFPVSKQMVIAK